VQHEAVIRLLVLLVVGGVEIIRRLQPVAAHLLGRADGDLLVGAREMLGEDAAHDAVDLGRAVAGLQRFGHPGIDAA
jgi:hypothetical protein